MQVKINRIMLPAYSYFIASGYPQSDMVYLSGRISQWSGREAGEKNIHFNKNSNLIEPILFQTLAIIP
jgi:hypothetical protein